MDSVTFRRLKPGLVGNFTFLKYWLPKLITGRNTVISVTAV